LGTRIPQEGEHAAASIQESSADADPYLVSLAKQGRPRFKRRVPSDEVVNEHPAPEGDSRDQDPYLVGLARHARGRKPAGR